MNVQVSDTVQERQVFGEPLRTLQVIIKCPGKYPGTRNKLDEIDSVPLELDVPIIWVFQEAHEPISRHPEVLSKEGLVKKESTPVCIEFKRSVEQVHHCDGVLWVEFMESVGRAIYGAYAGQRRILVHFPDGTAREIINLT